MAVNITAVLDIAAALSQEGHPNSAKHLRDAVAEIERLSTERVGAQGEWQVVPVRPTLDMLAAGRVVLISSSEVWAAMLAAAPPPEPQPEIVGIPMLAKRGRVWEVLGEDGARFRLVPDSGEPLPQGWKNEHCNGNPEVGHEAK
jgi:hypothetical protein